MIFIWGNYSRFQNILIIKDSYSIPVNLTFRAFARMAVNSISRMIYIKLYIDTIAGCLCNV